MNKQQLMQLEEQIREAPLTLEYCPPLPPGPADDNPHEGIILFGGKQFELDIVIWRGYHHDPATQYQPAEEGWADNEHLSVRSPFLTDLLTELEDREIAVPYPTLEAV